MNKVKQLLLSFVKRRAIGKTVSTARADGSKQHKAQRLRLRKKRCSKPASIPSLLRLLKQHRFDEIIEILQFQKQNNLTLWLSAVAAVDADDSGGGGDDESTWAESTALHAVIEYAAPVAVIDLMVQKLTEIKRGYMPEASVNKLGQTPLHIAAQRGSELSVIQRLTAVSELPALTMDAAGRFPLHYACAHRSASTVDTVHHLLDLYPQAVMVADGSGRTPLDLAAKTRQHPRVILELSMAHRQIVVKQTAARRQIPRLIQTSKETQVSDDLSSLGSIGAATLVKRRPPVLVKSAFKDNTERVRFAV